MLAVFTSSKVVCGAVVPMPKPVPFAYKEEVAVPFPKVRLLKSVAKAPSYPLAAMPPAKVDVAAAVFVIAPETVSVPVAVMFANVALPETRRLPWTPRVAPGVVVPTPSVLKTPSTPEARSDPPVKVRPDDAARLVAEIPPLKVEVKLTFLM